MKKTKHRIWPKSWRCHFKGFHVVMHSQSGFLLCEEYTLSIFHSWIYKHYLYREITEKFKACIFSIIYHISTSFYLQNYTMSYTKGIPFWQPLAHPPPFPPLPIFTISVTGFLLWKTQLKRHFYAKYTVSGVTIITF